MTTADADIASVYHAPRAPALRAVLFDLDDTLFDHERAAREALYDVRAGFACFASVPPEEFERAHTRTLEQMHALVLAGEIGIDEARVERFRRLLGAAGQPREEKAARAAARRYRAAYLAARRPVAGATALLAAMAADLRIAIVSNNVLEEQRQKLAFCGLDGCVHALVVSEEVGASKPDPVIFEVALARVGCAPREAVMIGDSWTNDVLGALAVGIPAIWFNPAGQPPPDPHLGVPELRDFEPSEATIAAIRRAHSASRAHRD